MNKAPFIAIEGPIGIGKTTLARKLATHFNYRLLEEVVDQNPFLGQFYQDMNTWSFQTEMFFLTHRFQQIEKIASDDLALGDAVVADYHIDKSLIFSKRTLSRQHLQKYTSIFHTLTDDLPKPNIIVYLQASIDTLLTRINRRAREIEEPIESDYLLQLIDDYQTYMMQFTRENPDIPIIRIDCDQLDFVARQHDLDTIIQQITPYLPK